MKKILFSLLLVITSAIAAMASGHTVGISSQTDVACTGNSTGSVTVTVSGGVGPFDYSWSPGGQTTASITGLTAGTYTVTVTDNADMSTASASVTITQPATILTASASANPSTICYGEALQLNCNASGGVPAYNYQWGPGTDMSSNFICGPTATPLTSKTYTLTVTDMNGCITTTSVNITVNGAATTINGTTVICNGSGTTLTATGGGTYSWNTGATTAAITVSPTTTTSYTITTTNAGCTGSASVAVTVAANLIPTISGTTTICDGLCTTLTGTGGNIYSWSPTSGTAASITVCPTVSTTYTLTVASGICSGSATVAVTVNPNPVPTITGSTTVCSGSGATLTASGGTAYSWNPGAMNTNPIIVFPASTTSYTVTAYSLGCTGSATAAVTVSSSTLTGITVSDSVFKETCLGTGDGAIDINLSGSHPGPFTYQWSNGMSTEDITNLTSGYYSVTVFDSAMNCWGNNYQVLADGTNCGTLSGKIFDDQNSDCSNNVGDVDLSNIMVVANPGSYIAFTNNQGDYIFNSLPYAAYTITQQITSPYIFPTCTSTLNANLNAGNKNITNLDFADTTASLPKDVSMSAYSSGIVPGFSCSVNFYLTNLTNNPASGTLCIVLPTGYGSLVTSGTSGYSITGDTVCWSYSNLVNYYSYFIISFTVPVNTPLGSIFKACATATVIGGDVNPSNNYYCYERIVTGSFDPNDKAVSPVGQGTKGNITLADNTLDYRIRFQNTGNGPAVNIVVKDTLSDKLDISTLEFVRSSHNYILDVMPGNVLRWKFNNIMLADSFSNEPASHGWISYRIKQNSSNQIGDEIKNTAHIYFDFNEAVVTNTTLNTIAAPVGIKETTSSNNIVRVYPNPFSDNTTFVIKSDKLNENYTFELLDVLGKQVRSIKEINTKEFQVSRNGLPNGIYFYKIYSTETVVDVGKLVIK
ncbi:MAG: DUF7619 domain-containing protein [Bacteroidota bacterium]